LRVGIVYGHLGEYGGVENVVLNQAKLLRKVGYDAYCFFSHVNPNLLDRLNEEEKSKYVRYYFRFPAPNNETVRLALSIPLAPFIIRFLEGLEVLICHGYSPAPFLGYTLKVHRKIPYISYIHFPPRFLYLESWLKKFWNYTFTRRIVTSLGWMVNPPQKILDRVSIKHSDFVLVNSRFTGRRIESIYGVKTLVCYPPVDTSIFRPLNNGDIKGIRGKLGFPLILSVGRIVPIKRVEWLIEMMKHIKEEYPSAMLAIVGEISDENKGYVENLKYLTKRMGLLRNVKFLGYKSLEELIKLYNAADVYVYQAPKEDFGLGPVEAMACGTPVVAWNDNAGPSETVIDGKTGFKALPYNIYDFAEKVMKLINIGKECFQDNLISFVCKNFSSENHLKTLVHVLNNVCL